MTGRPRDPSVDDAIRRAVVELIERQGYRGLSMEGIAAAAGVSKQTVYRRYRSKGEAVVDTLSTYAITHLPTPDTGTLVGDLTALLTATFRSQQTVNGTMNRALAAESVQDPAFGEQVWQQLITPRRNVIRSILARARERGEVTHPDDEMLIDLVYGPMWYRLLFDTGTLTEEYATTLARTVAAAARLSDSGR